MGTGASLTASERVQRLQTALHAKAKGAPGFRFYSLSDKVWRDDVLAVAWQTVRRNGGAAGVDDETVAEVPSPCPSTNFILLRNGPANWLSPACRSAVCSKRAFRSPRVQFARSDWPSRSCVSGTV